MAWLLHPDDYDRLISGIAQVAGIPRAGLGAQEILRDPRIEHGHIRDNDHPELGTLTFAEFGKRYAQVLEDERKAFDRAVEVMERAMAPMRPMPFPAGPSVALDLDDKAS